MFLDNRLHILEKNWFLESLWTTGYMSHIIPVLFTGGICIFSVAWKWTNCSRFSLLFLQWFCCREKMHKAIENAFPNVRLVLPKSLNLNTFFSPLLCILTSKRMLAHTFAWSKTIKKLYFYVSLCVWASHTHDKKYVFDNLKAFLLFSTLRACAGQNTQHPIHF